MKFEKIIQSIGIPQLKRIPLLFEFDFLSLEGQLLF